MWKNSKTHNCICKVIEEKELWGQTICRVWLPNSDAVVKVPKSDLLPINEDADTEKEVSRITYISAAAKINDVLDNRGSSSSIFIAPMESNVIPLPHQLNVLSRAMSKDQVRYLLADEVGLGKTIEGGLILKELKLRGLVKRTLVIAPKSIAPQWVSEMDTHFNEEFKLIRGEDIVSLDRVFSNKQESTWTLFNQVIVSLDSVKPLQKRRGWSKEKIDAYNASRFENLVTAGWDLVIIDEAHRLGGSTDQVARYKLGQGLAEAAPYFLLLSATPHQGKTDAFHRLMSLLDKEQFPDEASISKEKVQPYIIRTEKRKAVASDGSPLFMPRKTEMHKVEWGSKYALQEQLYENVTEYIREGYNQAMKDKKYHVGFLMILMQRLVVSSTHAIRTTLERRLDVLKDVQNRINDVAETIDDSEEFYDITGQELLEQLSDYNAQALDNEIDVVERLLEDALDAERDRSDAKADALLDIIYTLQSEENDQNLKLLIFTEFIPTQAMLEKFLTERGISVVCLNGSLDMDQRKQVQADFRNKARVLISTDAGGEGLNLQFCHVVVNYDIPWNPMRLEQRIGRVDRIGQAHLVRAINFVFSNSVEHRVREVLEEKLGVIFREFGIDKTGDVLDSAEAGEIFETIFKESIINPDQVESTIENNIKKLRAEISETKSNSLLDGLTEEPDLDMAEKLRMHPLPYWLELMTLSYLKCHKGNFDKKHNAWNLTWPDGTEYKHKVFNSKETIDSKSDLLNMEDSRIRGILSSLPLFSEGHLIPKVTIADIPESVNGIWGLYEIKLSFLCDYQFTILRRANFNRKYISVFISSDGNVYIPTSKHIWDKLIGGSVHICGYNTHEISDVCYKKIENVAQKQGEAEFNELLHEHLNFAENEIERMEYFFEYRRNAIDMVGLPEVRKYRTRMLEQDIKTFQEEIDIYKEIVPEIRPLLILNIVGAL